MCERSVQECVSGPFATPKPTGTRVHGLSAVPVKRRCGRSLVTAAVLDLVGKKEQGTYIVAPGTIGGEEERAWANSVPYCTILHHDAYK